VGGLPSRAAGFYAAPPRSSVARDVIVVVERGEGKAVATVCACAGAVAKRYEVDYVFCGFDFKYPVEEGVVEARGVRVAEVDAEWLGRRGVEAEEGRKYRVLLVRGEPC